MSKKEDRPFTRKAKKAAAVSAVTLLTAASVMTGSLFDSPEALLRDDGAAIPVCGTVTPADGAKDGDAGVEDGESEEMRRRGVRAALRQRILRLPLAVRLLIVLPIWALGGAILAVLGALWPLLSPVLGKLAGFALAAALLAGAFLSAAKAVFPDLPLKKLLSRHSLAVLLLGAAGLMIADAVLPAVWDGYARAREIVLSVSVFLALACVTVPFALREQKRRLAAPPKAAAKRGNHPEKLVFTDGVGTFTITVPGAGG